ncbi:hypothetical protein NLM27_41970 [Bradyrhizobium sp. CCGB12]|uniref:hypothetical protein n=1 Tax=Bradyrhizobium sp. CCGB12 TaxID=2949632 RepID=UPI0020B2ED43|nr:hypothetical protein [Bradyrhizobium sp. CCGB12]MCP3395303.1 hypothetical protein [Bradyrhizobium sp. CCGB12]
MNRRSLLFTSTAAVVTFCAVIRAAAWELISKDQADAVNSKPTEREALPSQDSRAPVIKVESPNIDNPVKTPVSIRLRFTPQPGATIDPKSFQAKYGWFDITKQIVANAKVDATGLTADNAQIPPGRYRVTLQVADTSGHVGKKVIEFTVVAS